MLLLVVRISNECHSLHLGVKRGQTARTYAKKGGLCSARNGCQSNSIISLETETVFPDLIESFAQQEAVKGTKADEHECLWNKRRLEQSSKDYFTRRL